MPSTTESGLTSKKTKISAAKLMGREEGDALGKVGQGSDKAGALPSIVRSNKKAIAINARKITLLKNIEKAKKDPIGDKLPGGDGGLKGILGDIASSMDGIKETLIQQNKLDKKAAANQRKQDEKKKRSLKESALEGVKGTLKKAGEAMLKPFKSLWDTILDFLKAIFLGRIAMKLFDWFADPKNTDKIKSIFRFIVDWWPVIVAGIMAVVGPGVTFAVGAVALLMWGIPKIIDAVKSVFNFGKDIDKELKTGEEGANKDIKDTRDKIRKDLDEVAKQGEEDQPDVKPVETPDPDAQQIPAKEMAKGGEVPGKGDDDTVPAMLTPGEFVMSKGAVGTWGKDMLEGMNAAGGGTNKPQKDNGGVTHAAGGGLISGVKDMVGGMMGGDNFAKDMVKEHEGLRTDVYKDSRGFPTVGYGHLVDGGSPKDIRDLEIGDTITEERANQLFENDFKHHKKAAQQIPGWSKGNKEQKAALIDLTFNMGPAWYKEFPKFSAALEAGNFEEAGKQLVDSDWYGQVGRRSPTIVDLIRGKGVSKGSYLKGGSGSKVGSGNNVSASEGGASPANISAPPGAPPPLPPIKPSSTVAYAEQQSQEGGGKTPALDPAQTLPNINASTMNSQEKISVLGISV